MWLMCFKNSLFDLHDVQLALHKKDRSKGSKKLFCQNQKKCRDSAPVQIAGWKNQPAERIKEGVGYAILGC